MQLDWGHLPAAVHHRADASAPFSPLLELDGDHTSDVEDINIGAKVRFLSETGHRPAIGIPLLDAAAQRQQRVRARQGRPGFRTSHAIGKTVQSVRVVGQHRLLDPRQPDRSWRRRTICLTYGLSVARAISPKAEIVGEFVGRANFAEHRHARRRGSRLAALRRALHPAACAWMAASCSALTPRDPRFGFTGGLTWVFDAFKVPVMRVNRQGPRLRQRLPVRPGRPGRRTARSTSCRGGCASATPASAATASSTTRIAPDGTARMRLINADGSPSELSGQRPALPGRTGPASARHARRAPLDRGARGHRRRLEDADAGRPRTAAATPFAPPWGSPSASSRRRSTAPARR